MSTSVAPATTDRADFRTVVVGGTRLGVLTVAAVALFLAVSRFVPGLLAQRVLETLIVLATAVAASFLPARWTAARRADGIAGAAATGLVGTLVFSVADVTLRQILPFKPYPWTWLAVGGGSNWWWLPLWWMLGTFAAWMGAYVTAGQAARGEPTLTRCAAPVMAGALIVGTVARLAGAVFPLPVQAGAAFTVSLAGFAVAALVRTR